ncbi:MAG: thrombospondin type 3 repeat-containing protein [bacterium]|nr:thrombospondin type 3 repeat-containing protein [bacterium]
MNLLKQLLNRFLLIYLSGVLVIILGVSVVGLFTIDIPQTQAAATSLAYSNDPTTGHVGIYGANPVIGFNNPVGTWFRICNGGTCTGYAQSFTQPQQYGGFKWIFDGANHGDVLEAQPQGASGYAQCTLLIAGGYRYCNVGIPDDDGDGVPNVADSCPSQGSIGYGIDASGCPIIPPDTDGDGILDPNDSCPTQGSIGYGVDAVGCPIQPSPIPDTDGDGILNPNDACPNQGSIGYGIDAVGCPNPPPQTDRDGDGKPDSQDACPDNGDIGYGVDGNGCPNPTPTPFSGDRDGDSVLDNADNCPDEKGSRNNLGCPYRPDVCQVAFLAEVVYLRAGPSTAFPSQTSMSYHDRPILAINAVTNDLGEIWYELQGSAPLYVRSDLVLLGQVCDSIGIGQVIITATPTPPLPTDGYIPPEQQLAALGCAIQPGEYVENAPDYILVMIVESPDPCQAKYEVNNPVIIAPPMQVAHQYFDDTPEKERFFQRLLDCSTPVVDWVIQWVNSDEDEASLEQLIAQAGNSVCSSVDEWRSAPVIPLPADTPPQQAIEIGIIICSNAHLTQARYQHLRQYLMDIWGMTVTDVNCMAINSANRMNIPTESQLALYAKLRECQVINPLNTLETLIMTNNDAIDLTLSCDTFIEKLTCEDCPPIELPIELVSCVLNDADWGLMTLFLKNHMPLLTENQLDDLYRDINPCDAITTYLNTGIIRLPIELPPPADTTPSPEITPTLTPEASVNVVIDEPRIPQEILMELGFDKPNISGVELDTVGVIFVRDNTIFIREKGVEKAFDDDIIGEKYVPILFTVNNRRLLAYIVVNEGTARIRIINLSTNDSTFAQLSDLITPDHLAPLAYNGSLLVFTGIDPNGQSNLYGIPFSATKQDNIAVLLVNNAQNATAIEGLSAFVFEQPNAGDNIFLWIPGSQTLDPLDEGIEGACTSPVGERFGAKWRFWFLCDGLGAPILYVRDMQAREPLMYDINGIMPSKNPITSIALGELQGELFLEDGEMVYWYHKRDKTEKIVRFIPGASAIYTFSRE